MPIYCYLITKICNLYWYINIDCFCNNVQDCVIKYIEGAILEFRPIETISMGFLQILTTFDRNVWILLQICNLSLRSKEIYEWKTAYRIVWQNLLLYIVKMHRRCIKMDKFIPNKYMYKRKYNTYSCMPPVYTHRIYRCRSYRRYLFAPAAILLSYLAVSFPTSSSYLSCYRPACRQTRI